MKRILLPKNIGKTNRSAQFGENTPTAGGGNEAWDILEEVQSAITKEEITLPGGGGGANLSYTVSPTQGVITSDSGTDATLPLADNTNAGLLSPSNNSKLGNITITQPVDLDVMEADVADLTTLSGVASNSVNLGTFTGTTIPDNQTIKQSLQSLESSVETKQKGITFKDEGVALGTVSTVDEVDFTGSGVTATRVGNKVTVAVSGGGGGGGSTIQVVESDSTIIMYEVLSGTPVVSASRTGGVQTIAVASGTVRILSVATKGATADLAGDNSFKIIVNGVLGTSLLAYPNISKWNLSGGAPSDAVPDTQDIDNTPQVQVSAGTAGTSITIKVINLNAYTNWVIKAVW